MAYNEFTAKILWVGQGNACGTNALLCLLLGSALAAEGWGLSPARRDLPWGCSRTHSLNCQQMNMKNRSLINSHLWCSSIINVGSKHPFRAKTSPPKSSWETCSCVPGCRLTGHDKQAQAGLSKYTKEASVTSTTRTRYLSQKLFSSHKHKLT